MRELRHPPYYAIKLFVFLFFVSVSGCKDKEATSPKKTDFYHEGKAIFWISNSSYGSIDIYIDGDKVGTIISYSYNAPTCETPGFVTITKPLGTYHFTAFQNKSPYNQWSGELELTGDCRSMRLN